MMIIRSHSCHLTPIRSLDTSVRYSTADTIEVLPTNSREDIEYFVEAFGLAGKLHHWIDFKPVDGK